jgi:uncharacterized LabA/DUF88 family protein
MATHNNGRLAVLIDADNAQASVIQELLAEVSRYGTATIKRAYGDWTTTNLKGWKDVLHKMAIQPVQQFSYTSGKNATDSALIIDAMDVLHTGRVDGFCLVSSDSDFTRLATRIREAGLVVYGFGERKTPEPLWRRATSSSTRRFCDLKKTLKRRLRSLSRSLIFGNFNHFLLLRQTQTPERMDGRLLEVWVATLARFTLRLTLATMASTSSVNWFAV